MIMMEMKKLIRRKFVLLLLLIYGVMLISVIYTGNPDHYTPVLTSEGEVLKGKDALNYERELTKKYAVLSDENVQEILKENARILREYTDQNQMKDGVHYRYANGFYSSVARIFTDGNGNYNHLPADQVYQGQKGFMKSGVTIGMDMLFSYLSSYFIFAVILIIIMIAPIFSDEYTTGMDSLILSSKYGKTKCIRAKILSAFFLSLFLFAVTILFLLAVTVAYFGTGEFSVDAHLCVTGMIGNAPYELPYWKAILILCGIALADILTVTGFTLAASAYAPSSFVSVLVSLAFFVVPIFFWGRLDIAWLNHLLELFPGNLLSPMMFFSLPAYEFGSRNIQMYQVMFLTAVCFAPISTAVSALEFHRHQVRS